MGVCQISDEISGTIEAFSSPGPIEEISKNFKNMLSMLQPILEQFFNDSKSRNRETINNFLTQKISTKFLQVLLIILFLKLPGEGVTNAEIVRLKFLEENSIER